MQTGDSARKKKRKKTKKDYYKKNREKEAEKARERMRKLRDKRRQQNAGEKCKALRAPKKKTTVPKDTVLSLEKKIAKQREQEILETKKR